MTDHRDHRQPQGRDDRSDAGFCCILHLFRAWRENFPETLGVGEPLAMPWDRLRA